MDRRSNCPNDSLICFLPIISRDKRFSLGCCYGANPSVSTVRFLQTGTISIRVFQFRRSKRSGDRWKWITPLSRPPVSPLLRNGTRSIGGIGTNEKERDKLTGTKRVLLTLCPMILNRISQSQTPKYTSRSLVSRYR